MRTLINSIILSVSFFPMVLLGQAPLITDPLQRGLSPANCEAMFTYEQDTSDILIFNFYDQSTGNITDYSWDFGDGSTGSGQVVSHSFPGIGTFKVCLTISNNDTANFCADSICKIIDLNPHPVHLLGGLLYAGNFPINNPFNTSDFGYAYLYRLQSGQIVPVDTVQFDTLGYFYFLDVPEGDYIIKAGLKENSRHFSSYMPGYHTHSPGWEEADTLHLASDFFMAHIHMQALLQPAAGTSSLVGYVTQDEAEAVFSRPGSCEVILSDSSGNPLKISYTNTTGGFYFDNLPQGTYILQAEHTGLFSDRVHVAVDDLHPVSDSIEIKLHQSPQGISPGLQDLPFAVSLYPNPASEKLNLDIRSSRNIEVQYELINSMGSAVLRGETGLLPGNNPVHVDLSTCPSGLYIIIINETGSPERFTAKLVIL